MVGPHHIRENGDQLAVAWTHDVTTDYVLPALSIDSAGNLDSPFSALGCDCATDLSF